MVYYTEKRIEIVASYYRNDEYAKAATRMFNRNYSDRTVCHQYVKIDSKLQILLTTEN